MNDPRLTEEAREEAWTRARSRVLPWAEATVEEEMPNAPAKEKQAIVDHALDLARVEADRWAQDLASIDGIGAVTFRSVYTSAFSHALPYRTAFILGVLMEGKKNG